MKIKTLKICCWVLLICTLGLVWQSIYLQRKNELLQTNIDYAFSSNFTSLYNNLFGTVLINDKTVIEANVSAGCCKLLFTSTSYSKNTALQSIVLILAEMVPPNAKAEIIEDRDVIDSLGYFLQRLDEPDAEDLANNILEKLSNILQKPQ